MPPASKGELTLDFTSSKNPRSGALAQVVTADNRSSDFAIVSRGAEDIENPIVQPGERYKQSRAERTYSKVFKFCCCIACLLVVAIIGVIVVSAVTRGDAVRRHHHHHDANSTASPTASPTTASPPATTQSPPPPAPTVVAADHHVSLSFLCNHALTGDDAGQCMAVFTYTNAGDAPVAVEPGANNYIEPGSVVPRTSFSPGLHYGGAAFKWDCTAHMQASWTLRTGGGVSVATAPRTHVECPPLNAAAAEAASQQQ